MLQGVADPLAAWRLPASRPGVFGGRAGELLGLRPAGKSLNRAVNSGRVRYATVTRRLSSAQVEASQRGKAGDLQADDPHRLPRCSMIFGGAATRRTGEGPGNGSRVRPGQGKIVVQLTCNCQGGQTRTLRGAIPPRSGRQLAGTSTFLKLIVAHMEHDAPLGLCA